MKHNIVVPVGSHLESTYAAIREFPTEKLFLLSTGKNSQSINELKKTVEPFRILTQELEIKGNLLEGMFRAFASIKSAVPEESLLVNVSSGENMENCAALAAAYVNGLKAFSVSEDKVTMLPVLKFSYYRLMPERKLKILKFLKTQPDCCSSLEDLAGRLKMTLPLASYHINGNAKAEGLVSQGLVEVHVGPRGRSQVTLTELGRLLAEGLVETAPAITA